MVTSRTTRHGVATVVIALLAGCSAFTSVTIPTAHYRAATAGVIGCPVEEIAISGEQNEVKLGAGPVTWRAACRGHQFICSHGGGQGDSARCAEELKAVLAETSRATPKP